MLNSSHNTLVSIIVLTYNSSNYVIETLNSILNQTYKNFEIIITDDFSTDDTVEKVMSWIKANGEQLPNCILNVNKINLGVSANCNAGLGFAKGQWIKLIAGDDILLPQCIGTFVEYTYKEPSKKLFVSKLKYFTHSLEDCFRSWPIRELPKTLKKQIYNQLCGGFIKAPAVFINKALLLNIGGFDEDYKFFEDDPLWLKLLKSGEVFYLVPKYLVGYRIHDQAISNGNVTRFLNPKFFASYAQFKRQVVFKEMIARKMYLLYFISNLELNTQAAIIKRGNLNELVTFTDKIIFKLARLTRKMLQQ